MPATDHHILKLEAPLTVVAPLLEGEDPLATVRVYRESKLFRIVVELHAPEAAYCNLKREGERLDLEARKARAEDELRRIAQRLSHLARE